MDPNRWRLRQIQNRSFDMRLMAVKRMGSFLDQPQDFLTRFVAFNLCEAFIVLIWVQLDIGQWYCQILEAN